jgi:hypothetical protein
MWKFKIIYQHVILDYLKKKKKKKNLFIKKPLNIQTKNKQKNNM